MPNLLAIVLVRGFANVRGDVLETLKRLGLRKANFCVLVPETPEYLGMIQKAKDRVAYGIIDRPTLLELLRKRGRLVGDKAITDESVRELGFKSLEELADALETGGVKALKLKGLKPIFRLHPPSHGYGSVKRPYPEGALGNWGQEVNQLLRRMI